MNLVILLLAVTIGVVSAQYGGGAPGPAYLAPVAGPSIPWGPPFHHHRYRSWSRSDSRNHSRSRSRRRSRNRSRSSEEKCYKCKKLGLYRGPSPVPYVDPKISYEMNDGCWQAVASCPFDGKAWILGGFANKAPKDSDSFRIGGAIALQRVITCTDEKEWEATELRNQTKVQFKYVTCVLFENMEGLLDQVPTSVFIPLPLDLPEDPTATPTIVAPSEPTQPTAALVTTSSAGTTGPGTSTGTTTGARTEGTTPAATVSTTGTTTPATNVIIPLLPDLPEDPTATPTIVAPSEPTQPTAAPVTTSSAGTTDPGTSTGTTTGARTGGTTPAVTVSTTGTTTPAATVSTTRTTTPAVTVSTTGTTTPAATVSTTGTTTPATTTASTTAAAPQKSAARTQGPVATTTVPIDETPDNGQAEREYQALLREAGLLD